MKRLLLTAALLCTTAAQAHEYYVGDLEVDHPVTYPTVANAPVGAGYMTIINSGDTDDRLISASVAGDVAGQAQLHQMALEDGIMRMSQVDGGIPIPAGETVLLESGGLHVMFLQLAGGLEEGETFPGTLTFENAGPVEVVFHVEARPAPGSEPVHHHDDDEDDAAGEHDHH